MSGGRPPLPTAVKAAQGTLRKHREAGKGPEAIPLEQAPPPPARFEPQDYVDGAQSEAQARARLQRRIACETWLELAAVLVERKVLTRSDLMALELCCWEYARWRVLGNVVEEEGQTVAQCNGDGVVTMVMAHPAVGQMDRALANVDRLLTHLGLTPSARVRVRGAAVDQAEQNPFAALLARRGPQGLVASGKAQEG